MLSQKTRNFTFRVKLFQTGHSYLKYALIISVYGWQKIDLVLNDRKTEVVYFHSKFRKDKKEKNIITNFRVGI